MALLVYSAWPAVAAEYGASAVGQDVRRVDDAPGWYQYLAKHIGRSAGHRQRSSLPPGWEKSGRLWSHWGEWPTWESGYHLDMAGWHQLRRIIDAWALADARSEVDQERRRRRVRYLRRRRRRAEDLSAWMGRREWCPPQVVDAALVWLWREGYTVELTSSTETTSEAPLTASEGSPGSDGATDAPGGVLGAPAASEGLQARSGSRARALLRSGAVA